MLRDIEFEEATEESQEMSKELYSKLITILRNSREKWLISIPFKMNMSFVQDENNREKIISDMSITINPVNLILHMDVINTFIQIFNLETKVRDYSKMI